MKRCWRELRGLKYETGVDDLDATVLRRQFEWAGHLVRRTVEDPARLSAIVLNFFNEDTRNTNRDLVGRMGWGGRVNPWSYENQFVGFFSKTLTSYG